MLLRFYGYQVGEVSGAFVGLQRFRLLAFRSITTLTEAVFCFALVDSISWEVVVVLERAFERGLAVCNWPSFT
jgi:hypothetical protein